MKLPQENVEFITELLLLNRTQYKKWYNTLINSYTNLTIFNLTQYLMSYTVCGNNVFWDDEKNMQAKTIFWGEVQLPIDLISFSTTPCELCLIIEIDI